MTDPVPLRPQSPLLDGGDDRAARVARELPHNIEVEQALLGALLRRPVEVYDAIANSGLEAGHFYAPEHFAVFDVIRRRLDRGRAVTIEAIYPALEGDGGLGEVGADYLHEIQAGIITTINAADYAATLIDLWRRRELILRLRETTEQLYDLSDVDATAAQIGEQASDDLITVTAEQGDLSGGVVTLERAVADQIAAYERAAQDPDASIGLMSGLVDFDRILDGFEDGRLYIVAARPAMGKTAFAQALASRLAANSGDGWSILFNLEMSAGQLAGRALSTAGKMDMRPARRGRMAPDQWDRMMGAAESLKGARVVIDARDTQTLASIERVTRQQMRKRRVACIVVDYLQLVTASAHARRYGNRVNEVSEMTRELKKLAKRFDLPVIVLSQLSRQVENREDKRPHLSDLRESGSIEQDADSVMFLYREQYYLEQEPPQQRPKETAAQFYEREFQYDAALTRCRNVLDVIVAKNRDAPTGTAKLFCELSTMTIDNLAQAESAQEDLI
jgi:replicative DNA helicase